MKYKFMSFAQATDTISTGRVLKAVVQLCFDAEDWEGLNEYIVLLSKRRAQLKTVCDLV